MDISNSVVTYFLPLIQLIILFLQERREDEEMTLERFGEWLDTHQFSEIKCNIEKSHELQIEIKSLLSLNHNQLINRLAFIEELLAKISSQMEGFSGLAGLTNPNAHLSDQAIHFLKSFNDADVTDIFAVMRFGAITQIVLHRASERTGYSNDTSNIVDIAEPRFVAQDLEDLISLNLIKCDDFNSDGGKTFYLTRQGARFLKTIEPT